MSNWVIVKGKQATNQEWNGGMEGAANLAFSGAGSRVKLHAKTGQYSAALSNETLTLTGAALPNVGHIVTAWACGDPPTTLGVGATTRAPRVLDVQGDFTRYGALFTAAECNGQTARKVTTTGTTWVDDVCTLAADDWDDVSEAFDGETAGCRWRGSTFNAPSFRPVDVLDNGQILAIDDMETVWCKMAVPPGMAPLEMLKQEAASGNTQIYQDTRLKERAIRLELHVKVTGFASPAEAREGWHKRIARLQRLFPLRRQFAVRYVGGARHQEFRVVLVGFEVVNWTNTAGNAHGDVVVLLTALDPRPKELVENRVALTMNRSLALSYFTARDGAQSGQWTSRGSGPGGTVRRVYVAPDHTEYVCTTSIAGAAYVKRRNADNTWTTICSVTGSLTAGPVVYDCVQSPDGTKLYVVGDFTTVNGVAGFNGLATITLSSLAAANMGTGCSGGHAERCRLSPGGDYLIIVGAFTSVSGTSANRVARRLLASGAWSAFASGLVGAAYALAVNQAGDLYVGGNFGASSGLSAPGAPTCTSVYDANGQLWDWPTTNGPVFQYKLTYLTVVGETEGGTAQSVTLATTPPSFHKGCDVSWSAGGAGTTGYRLWRTEGNGTTFYLLKEFAAGTTSYQDRGYQALDKTQTPPTINTSGHRTVNIARWDATAGAWKSVGLTGFNGVVRGLDVAPNGVDLVIIGDFTIADGNTSVNRIALWQGGQLLPCGSGLAGGSPYGVKRLRDGRVVVVGAFTSAGGMTACAQMAYWTGGVRGAWLPADIVWPAGATLYSVAESYDDILVGHDSAGTATAAALTSVTVEGQAGSQPVWETLGPGVLRALINQRTGDALAFSEAAVIAANETWRFDSADLAKTLTSTGQPGSLVGRILMGSNRGTWALLPDDNPVLLLVTGTDGNSTSVLRDRVTNLSADGSVMDE